MLLDMALAPSGPKTLLVATREGIIEGIGPLHLSAKSILFDITLELSDLAVLLGDIPRDRTDTVMAFLSFSVKSMLLDIVSMQSDASRLLGEAPRDGTFTEIVLLPFSVASTFSDVILTSSVTGLLGDIACDALDDETAPVSISVGFILPGSSPSSPSCLATISFSVTSMALSTVAVSSSILSEMQPDTVDEITSFDRVLTQSNSSLLLCIV